MISSRHCLAIFLALTLIAIIFLLKEILEDRQQIKILAKSNQKLNEEHSPHSLPQQQVHHSSSSSIQESPQVAYWIKHDSVQKMRDQLPTPDDGWQRKSCTPVYFLASGKAGTTTLAALLKKTPPKYRHFDSSGGFSHSEKEVCWTYDALESTTPYTYDDYWSNFPDCVKDSAFARGNKNTKLAFDGCPKQWSDEHMKMIASAHPNAKFVLLARDPVDRMVSHYNMLIRKHRVPEHKTQEEIDEAYRQAVYHSNPYPDAALYKCSFQYCEDIVHTLSSYEMVLGNFLRYFNKEQLLIIETPSLGEHPGLVVEAIMKHFGKERAGSKAPLKINANKDTMRSEYPSPELKKEFDLYFQPSRDFIQNLTDHVFKSFRNV